jgi:hypothetical protein
MAERTTSTNESGKVSSKMLVATKAVGRGETEIIATISELRRAIWEEKTTCETPHRNMVK